MEKPLIPPPSLPKKGAVIGIRTTDDVKAGAVEAARRDRRSISQWVEGLILEAIKKEQTK